MKATIKDVAKAAGVSTATVSMVANGKVKRLSKETIERVEQVIRDLNYIPNRSAKWLRKREGRLLAMLVPDWSNSFYTEVAESVLTDAIAEGYLLTVLNLDEDDNELASIEQILSEGRFEGILIVSRKFDTIRKKMLDMQKLPCVLLDESFDNHSGLSLITGDNEMGGELVASHFLSLGHRKLACITGPEETPNSSRRLSGFVKTLNGKGVHLPVENIVIGDYTVQGGYHGAEKLKGREYTALFAFNDLMAIGAQRYFKEVGIEVPKNCSIIGYDHISISDYLYPKLTTVDQNASEIGRLGFRELLRLMQGNLPSSTIRVKPRLIQGESVAVI